MYKVLIADDEDIIRRGLAGMVSQHDQLEVVAQAEDGEVALEEANRTEPDIMLVDINMPFLNGLDFIHEAKALLPDAEIIIVTGYDDFAFVQKAIQLGVSDYVLKPIMEEPFFEVLDKAIARLDSRNQSRKYLEWLTQQIETNRSAMINDFFRSWLQNSLDRFEIEDRMQYLNIRIPIPYWVIVLHLRSDPDQTDSIADWDIDLLLYGCDNIIHEVFAPYCPVLTFRTEDGALAIISQVLSQNLWLELKEKLVSPIEEFLHVKAELLQQQGETIDEFPDVVESVIQAYKTHQRYSEPVVKAINLIDQNWGDSEFSLQGAADALFVSPQYLSRAFHREVGDTFGAYLSRKRLKEAMRLLQDADLKMYEIAQKTGYSSQHYFSNAFKRGLGVSPAEYRKNVLGQGGTK